METAQGQQCTGPPAQGRSHKTTDKRKAQVEKQALSSFLHSGSTQQMSAAEVYEQQNITCARKTAVRINTDIF